VRHRWFVLAVSIALAAVAAWRTWPGLSPPSFELDDLWVASLVKHATLGQVFQLGTPAPLGFVALLDAVSAVAGLGDWQLQSVAWVAYPVAIVGLIWLTLLVTDRPAAAFATGALLAMDSEVAGFAVRVKQYTLDLAVTVLLLLGTVGVMRAPRRWWLLAAGSIVAMLVSLPSAFTGPLLVYLLLVDQCVKAPAKWRGLLARAVAYSAVVAAVAFGLVRRQQTSNLIDYWATLFVPRDVRQIPAFLCSGPAWHFVATAFPEHARWIVLCLPLGVLTLVKHRQARVLGLFVGLFYIEMLVANALRLYPLGLKRLDTFAAPVALLAFGAGIAWPLGRLQVTADICAALLVVASVVTQTSSRVPVVALGDKAMVQQAVSQIRDSDGVVLFPYANWAVAYYGSWPSEVVPVKESTNGFNVIPTRAHTLVLPEAWNGLSFRDHLEAVEGPLRPFLAAAPPRIVYVGREDTRVIDAIRRSGYAVVRSWWKSDAACVVMERR
jgi:hypothetical protein